ncbi:MAG: CdaR family protein [Bryobacteraceae bacterium]|nr:CdaR family protein [Bryobacteraceae bacterium]MCX7605031.1 CdaR family protein [Bryobacteraceae bacterium]
MKRFFTHNIVLKLLSLALAFILWFVYSGSRELTTAISVPVQYRNIPTDLEIGPNLVEEVRLIVRGPSPLLSKVSASPAPVILDLGHVRRPGLTTFSIHRQNVSLPTGVVLERAIPSQIQILTETRVTKEVEVHPIFQNIPAGFRVVFWSATPRVLTLSGPKSRMDSIHHVNTDPIDLQLHGMAGRVKTTAFAGDPQAHFTESPEVEVEFRLERLPEAAPGGGGEGRR